MTRKIVDYIKHKLNIEGFKSKGELEFYKIAVRAIEKQMEIEEITKDWRENIDPEENCKTWVMYGIMESFLIDKNLTNYSFVSEIRKIQEKLSETESEIPTWLEK